MKITWLGHAAFQIETKEHVILIDPFLTDNPSAAKGAKNINADLILVTHGHADHLGDTVDIAQRTGAHVIAIHEIKEYLLADGIDAEGMNIGGTIEWAGFRIHMTPAFHSSGYGSGKKMLYMGMPAGFVISTEEGSVYHMGDTGLFGDIKLVAQRFHPDIVLAPIGDRFTMGPEDASLAIEWLVPNVAIPMHYGTWPLVDTSPDLFKELVTKKCQTKVDILSPGQSITYTK